MIAYTCLFTHNFSIYCLQHSKYQLKYRFWMFVCLFLNYYYFKTYPYCNVTLTNIVFMTFTLYQLSHNLFKFSFYFELMIIQLNRGNVAAYLQANIQNELSRRYTERTVGRQLEEQTRRREQLRRQREEDDRQRL